MTSNISYNQFYIKFTNLVSTSKIARSYQFNDVYKKISLTLKLYIITKKYKIVNDYFTLDEYLAITDRESRNIFTKEALYKKVVAVAVRSNINKSSGILKKPG